MHVSSGKQMNYITNSISRSVPAIDPVIVRAPGFPEIPLHVLPWTTGYIGDGEPAGGFSFAARMVVPGAEGQQFSGQGALLAVFWILPAHPA